MGCSDPESDDDGDFVADSQASQRPPADLDSLVEGFDDIPEQEIEYTEADEIKILVASDIHVGYGEHKRSRYLDSVNTFEEILQIATEKNVDFILLGGDLFHENNPSRDMQHRVVQLLRRYCLNDREIAMQFMSDPSVNFSQSHFDRVNYEDPNLNVGMPVFTIHGNHDDLAGKGLSALDLLHEAGLVNLFGKYEDIEKFSLSPILLRKGRTKLALYGLGSQRDDRLCRAFTAEAVKFLRPLSYADECFNLFVLHQNRPKRATHRTTGAYLPEQFIPNFFDLVVWGHEHECKPQPEYRQTSDAVGDGFYILQPGSTIATSLTHEEAIQKCVFQIKIRGRKFQIKPIPLQTTRQVVVDELIFDKEIENFSIPRNGTRPPGTDFVDEVMIREKLNQLIAAAKKTCGPQQPQPPALRLKVTYAGPWADMQPANGRRIGMRFDDQVANADDMIVTKKVKEREKKKPNEKGYSANQPLGAVSSSNVEDVIGSFFDDLPFKQRLTVLTHASISAAIGSFANESTSATKAKQDFDNAIKAQVDGVRSKLKSMDVPEITSKTSLDDFERVVSRDLLEIKRAVYGIRPEDVDEEMQSSPVHESQGDSDFSD